MKLKKQILIILILFSSVLPLSAQWSYSSGNAYYTGNVGIGTNSPKTSMQINSWANSSNFQTARQFIISGDDWGGLGLNQLGSVNHKYGLEIGYHFKYSDQTIVGGRIQSYVNGASNLMLNPDGGNVGIGTTNPKYRLDVNGTIHSQQIVVDLITSNTLNVDGHIYADQIKVKTNGQTADYVFADDYNLKSLSEVDAFIKENKHLPNIPSASEMEANGMDLAEMNKLLLQKVEELTLYIIDLEAKNENEKSQRASIETRLSQIEALLCQSKK